MLLKNQPKPNLFIFHCVKTDGSGESCTVVAANKYYAKGQAKRKLGLAKDAKGAIEVTCKGKVK